MTEMKGLAKAADIYANRERSAVELKEQGKKIAGYFCCYVPLELLTAADYVPVRILGDMSEPITTADTYLPTVMCVFYRSCLDLAMKGKYDYLDGLFGSHACDASERVFAVWRSYLKYPCSFMLDIAHNANQGAIDFFKDQLGFLKKVLEDGNGIKITDERLRETITLYNRQRTMVRELYSLRKADPPPISGTEMLQVLVAIMYMSLEAGNTMLEEVLAEVKSRPVTAAKKPRLLITGCLVDDISLTHLIEECGFNIVIDDTAIGTRTFGHDVELTDDPLGALAHRYLDKIVCPRTFRDTGKTRAEDLENRFGYLRKFVQEWKADAAYLNIIRNCDPHGYEVPELQYYLEEMVGVPVLVVEQDYSTASLAPLRTRFQAFAESIG
jgi:bcr-type benzoyl-CoA reductase subunit C